MYEVYARYAFPNTLPTSDLLYLGSGSYGSVYAAGNRYALKEHALNTLLSATADQCAAWEHEFAMHAQIYARCNAALRPFRVSIATPYQFAYATRTATHLRLQAVSEGATSCIYTMDRLPGRIPRSSCFEHTLSTLLQPSAVLAATRIPPYLFLGSVQTLQGHITLDMVQGATRVELPKESMNYCDVEGVALILLQTMFCAFFTIVCAGYMPRDIEFVLNGLCGPIHATVLDFNEVSTLEDRAKSGGTAYNLEEDIAHVYIDLCGLRASFEDVNPQAPYDSPTPQWKFLCSPLVSPNGFLACCRALRTLDLGVGVFDFDRIIGHVYDYIYTNYFRTAVKKLSGAYKRALETWTPVAHFSTPADADTVYGKLDSLIQKYIVAGMLDTLAHRGIAVPAELSDTYLGAIDALFTALRQTTRSNVVEDDWDVYRLF